MDDEAPEDLSHAGSVVDKAIEYMLEQQIAPVSAASALLGGALGLLARNMDDRAIAGVLRQALASVEAGELRQLPSLPKR
jgi:type II secretory pathway component PulF